MINNPPANAKDMSLSPAPGRSHMKQACGQQLLKPPHIEPVLHNKRNHCSEKPEYHNEA